jgi:peptide/nickel transport system substrate-binding protein
MKYQWPKHFNKLVLTPMVIVFLFAMACGGAEQQTPAAMKETPKEVVKEAPKEVPKEVVKEAPKEVVKEAPKEAVAAATPIQASAEQVGVAPGGKYGGVVPVSASTNPEDWDPQQCGSGNCMTALGKMFNTLVEYDPVNPGKIIPDLAESWEVSDDGLTYIFRIPDGIQWWDGDDLTAEDVAFSINRAIEAEKRRPRSGIIRTYVDRAEALDQNAAKVYLKFPSAAFFEYAASAYSNIVPKHIFEGADEDSVNKYENIVGSGPFKITSFTAGSDFEFVKNEGYFKEGRPYFDGIKVFIIPDPGRKVGAFLAEQVYLCSFPWCNMIMEQFLELEEKGEDILKVWWDEPSIMLKFHVNLNKEPFTDPKVVRAWYLAIDRHQLLDAFSAGKWRLASPLHPSFSSFTEEDVKQIPGFRVGADGNKHPDDIAEAQRLMAEAGYPGGQGFPPIDMVARSSVALYADMAAVIKQQMRDTLGIDTITIRPMESAKGIKAYRQGEWVTTPLAVGLLTTDPDDILQQQYHPKGAWNLSPWTHPKFIELFEKQTRETDPAKRKETLRELEMFLFETPKELMELWWQSTGWVVNKKVGGFVSSPHLTNAYMKLEHLWLEE